MSVGVKSVRAMDIPHFMDLSYEAAYGHMDKMTDWLINGSNPANDSISLVLASNFEKMQTLKTALQYISVFCLVFYAYVVFVIARHLRVTLNNPFYAYVISLAVTDLLVLMFSATRLSERKALRKPPWFWIIPFWIQVSWYSNLFNVLGLTCTRFVAVVLHRNARKLLQWRNVITSIGLVWLCSLVWALPILFSSQRECALDRRGNVVLWELAYYYRWMEIAFSIVIMVVCFLLYMIMFEFVRRARCKMERYKSRTWSGASSSAPEREPMAAPVPELRKSSSLTSGSSRTIVSLRQEFPILVQSFIITTNLALVLFSSYAHLILEETFLASAMNQCLVLLNSAMNPVLYILFSTAVRDLVFSHTRRNWRRHSSTAKLAMARVGLTRQSESIKCIDKGINRKISRSCPVLHEPISRASLVAVPAREPFSAAEAQVHWELG